MIVSAVILAVGRDVQMRSKVAKISHHLAGKPLLDYSIETTGQLTDSNPIVILRKQDGVNQREWGKEVVFLEQDSPVDPINPLIHTEAILNGNIENILIIRADMPLLSIDTLKRLVDAHTAGKNTVTFLTGNSDDSDGFNQIIRDGSGTVGEIVIKNPDDPIKTGRTEFCARVYCFNTEWLWSNIHRNQLPLEDNDYLDHILRIAIEDKQPVGSVPVNSQEELILIKNRVQLAKVEHIIRSRITDKWMKTGVTILDPNSTYIDDAVQIKPDTTIYPNTHLRGGTTIGEFCELGPNSIIYDTKIGDYCRVFNSVVESAVLENHVDIGPFAHLRKGAHLAEGVHMGNFGEIKNSYLGRGTKMGHFSYIGDATLGDDVNIGAGTITCNYDGQDKHPTNVDSGVFIGSDTMLVAPVNLGEQSRTGAGSVVTKDVPPFTVVAGVPARAIRKIEKSD